MIGKHGPGFGSPFDFSEIQDVVLRLRDYLGDKFIIYQHDDKHFNTTHDDKSLMRLLNVVKTIGHFYIVYRSYWENPPSSVLL